MSQEQWNAKPKVTETAGGLRDRAASLRWVAGTMQDADRAHELRQFAEQLERQAVHLERHQTESDRPRG